MTTAPAPAEQESPHGATARQALVATLVTLSVIVLALALWKLRVVLALLLLGFTIAAAMRPGVDWLAGWRVPRVVGVLLHYFALLGAIALFVWFVAPTLSEQAQNALDATRDAHAANGGGLKERALNALSRQLHDLATPNHLVHPALTIGEQALKVLAAVLLLAVAAYWIFERDRAVDLIASLLPRPKRKTLRDAWTLVDEKLGAFVRGELVLILFVTILAAIAFAAIGVRTGCCSRSPPASSRSCPLSAHSRRLRSRSGQASPSPGKRRRSQAARCWSSAWSRTTR